ncbi:MAG: zinc ribbon domain-containing protein [Lachnospiraceae bacterium]|nr:zinc ribbon domain-containing protein [Lachnospiraceae bacterium]
MAFCTNCGAQIADGAKFCPNCGAAQGAAPQPVQQPVYQQPAAQPAAQPVQQVVIQQAAPQQPANQAQLDSLASSSLTLGILAMIFCSVPIVGIILASNGKKKAKQYELLTGQCTGKAKAGRILSSIALPFAIIALICWIIYGIIAIVGGIAACASGAFQNGDFGDLLEELFDFR